FAEGQALQRIPMYMKDWIDKLHSFLQINNKEILKDAGKISHDLAVEIAERNFAEYKKNEAKKMDNDFDNFANKAVKLIGKGQKK
ncbi:MAG: RhuM family protein, partial [Candidatus Humimicrobiaceae bacterium]